MNTAKNIVHSFSHLFFPHTCAGCGNDLVSEGQLLCLQCMDQLPVTYFGEHIKNPVEKIFHGRVSILNAMSLLYFTKDSVLQHLLHQFKYRGKKEIGLYFGRMIGKSFSNSNHFNHVEALIPLPLFASKEKRRGYNQATVLCEGISQITRIPIFKNSITRVVATETQTHKTRIERWHNTEGKFELKDAAALQNKHVLLVDDVVTTGATLEACASELLRAEAVKVSIATLAYALL